MARSLRTSGRPHSLRTHLVGLVLAVLLPLVGFSAIVVVLFGQHERAAIERGLLDTARALSVAVDKELEASIARLEVLAGSRQLDSGDLAAVHETAGRVRAQNPDWYTIALFDATGAQLLDLQSPLGAPLPSVSDREHFRQVVATGRPAISNLIDAGVGQRRAVVVAVPVVRDGRLRYVLTAGIDLASLTNLLVRQQRIPADWTGAILDRNGLIIARNRAPAQWVGQPATADLQAASRARAEGAYLATTKEGTPVYAGFSRAPLSGWTVALGVPAAAVEGPLRRSLWMLGAVGVGLLVVAVGFASLLGRRIARAIAGLAAAAQRLGHGATVAGADVSPVREVNGLAREIDQAARLIHQHAEERNRAQAALQDTNQTLQALIDASHTLSANLDLEKVVQAVTDTATREAGARFGAFFYNVVDARGESYTLYTLSGASREAFASFPMPRNTQLFGPTFRGEVVRIDDVRQDPRYGKSAPYHGMPPGHLPVRSYLAVPVISRTGEVLGGLFFGHDQPGVFGEREERLVLGLAAQAAIAIDNARLYEAERFARAQAETAEARAVFLAEASAILASSLDYETTLASVARLAVPTLGDWCAVHVAEQGGPIRCLAAAHRDPAKSRLARELQERYPIKATSRHGVPRVLRTGQPELHPDFPAWWLQGVARDADDLATLRGFGFTSMMIVPLLARGRALGTITCLTAESGRRYDKADLAFAEELARRAATAVDNTRLYAEAHAANRAKDEFLATVSHELRTPLNAILGWAQLLRLGQRDEATLRRALDTIERNAKAQARLVNDLLDVSRAIAGKLRLDLRSVHLPGVIAATLETLRPAAEVKAIRFATALDPSVDQVVADPDRLQQIVWNLVSNAVKFTPQGGRVEVQVAHVESQVEITVADTGVGIPREFLPYVFERFRQADSTTTRTHSGLGLGLGIVRHLVELHGGAVRAESAGKGQGARFTVTLPLLPVAAGARHEGAPPGPATRAIDRVDAGRTLDGIRVLVVDDEADARDLISTVLQAGGARVTAVASAAEALDVLARQRPDVLVSDIGMPDEDGYALIRKVRALPAERGGRIPAAALTAYAGKDDRHRVLEAGYQQHVPKPVEPAMLTALVATLAWGGRR